MKKSTYLIWALIILVAFSHMGCAADTGNVEAAPQASASGESPSPEPVETVMPESVAEVPMASAGTPSAEKEGLPSSKALDYIAGRVDEATNRLYVYKDFADGLNNYTQKAFVGNHYDSPPAMDEKAAPYEGISSIRAQIDLTQFTWGGYMFVNGVLEAGSTKPELSFGEMPAGLDLSGADKLVFYAKGEKGGERVEFFLAGLGHGDISIEPYADSVRKITLGYITLSKQWERYEIDVAGYDLSSIGCGFGWVTNDVNNYPETDVAFYVDEIYFEFSEPRNAPVFLQSYAAVLDDTDDYVINNFAYTYDNALTVIALLNGGYEDQGLKIADALVYAAGNDRYFDDSRLRNAYMAGDPHSPPAWLSPRGGEYARMPGFYDTADDTWKEDYYAVSTSAGNMAWAVLALCEAYDVSGDSVYLETAQAMGDFLLTLKSDSGGFTAGYEGWEGDQERATYKSTEHNIDLIPAFARLAARTWDAQKATEYTEASDWAKEFVLSMYDEAQHCFYTGTGADGVTVSKDVLPLDTNTWGILALHPDAFADAGAVMEFVEQTFAVDGGYDFNQDRDGVWFEGTAQAALVYGILENDAQYGELMRFLDGHSMADGSITAADRDGVSTGFDVSGLDMAWKYNARQHLGATAWAALAQLGYNPLGSGAD